MNSVEIITKEQCFSCRACEHTCPTDCIRMEEDVEGFLYPVIDSTLCTSCGACLLHCPAHAPLRLIGEYSQSFYGLKLRDEHQLQKSASGGLFYGLARYVLDQGGTVFGAAYDDQLGVHQIAVSDGDALYRLRGSKYVASDTETSYVQVKEALKRGVPVLYTGVPCQIAGLRWFLGKDAENLFTADIICHGVPSQKLFKRYLEWLSKRLKEPVLYYGFRDKDVAGWSCGGKIKTKTKTKVLRGAVDPYYSSFMRGETYRYSCYSCPYASVRHRPADITMGDFWGVELFHPEFNTEGGVSCCIINTKKGELLFKLVRDKFICIQTTEESVSRYNRQLNQPVEYPKKRDSVYDGIDELPIEQFIKKLYAPLPSQIKRYVIGLIPQKLKTKVKQLLVHIC
ncbi:MAG: Coenzyme F420 hydrogenase/dehydrogenase, beta subunit C-terminal domain [Spirochaetaceae bacterium]|nr:Coenzyme F420 hydrogenase/dehydrogenase, beta subunit C-terminal domain [Spirochaetaceae bacterium]